MKTQLSLHRTLARYILGMMSEIEQARTEEDYFQDLKLLRRLLRVRERLVDAYLAGTMPETDRKRFERKAAVNPVLWAKLQSGKAFRNIRRPD